MPRAWAINIAFTLLISTTYWLLGLPGLSFAPSGTQVTPVWPPTGFSIFLLLRFGRKWWPAIFLGSLAVQMTLHMPLWVGMLICIGDTLEALIPGILLNRRHPFNTKLDRHVDAVALVVTGGLAGICVSALWSTTALTLAGFEQWKHFFYQAASWWTSNLTSLVLITPVLLTWSHRPTSTHRYHPLEVTLVVAVTTALLWLLFVHGSATLNEDLQFLMFVPLLWSSIRFGVRGTAMMSLALGAAAIAHVIGEGAVERSDAVVQIQLLQLFIAALSGTGLLLSSLSEERLAAEEKLTHANLTLESRVAERTLKLERESARVALLHQVSAAANESATLDEVLSKCLKLATIHSAMTIGHAKKLERESGGEVLISTGHWYSSSPEISASLLESHFGRRVSKSGDGVAGRALFSKTPQFERIGAQSGQESAFARDINVQAALAIPVIVGSRVRAVLEFFKGDAEEPDSELLDLLVNISSQIGRVIERSDSEKHILKLAMHDPLTELPNRVAFLETVQRAIRNLERRPGLTFAVLFIDLDGFKLINDSLGHKAGDRVLQGVAKRLADCVRGGDIIARMGGDEFTVFLNDVAEKNGCPDCLHVANRIVTKLGLPMEIDSQSVYVGASVGIAMGSRAYSSAEDIVRDADIAMYRSKNNTETSVSVFDPTMHGHAVSRLQLETDLRHAAERGELFLQYQPIVRINSQELEGFEALVRWQHPERGLIPPLDFIPLAEQTRLIIPIGIWVIEQACEWRRNLAQIPNSDTLTLSVNVSNLQFAQVDLAEVIGNVVVNSGLNPNMLKIEITESTLMENSQSAGTTLSRLRETGVRIAIDDFGTGYSSLAYLAKLPIDFLKIDRTFVSRILESDSFEIVRSMIDLAASLKLGVVAEGVENAQQLEVLASLGCELAQGYYFHRPLNAEAAFSLVQSSRHLTLN